jgi:alcohol dehydrogenase (cytochrome c)
MRYIITPSDRFSPLVNPDRAFPVGGMMSDPPNVPPGLYLTAVDPLSQEIRKNVHLRYANFSGTLATAGGLIFLALVDGTVATFDDTTLDELWRVNIGSGFSAPPMTFEVNGMQYVAIASGPSPPAKRRGLANTPELKDQRHATVLYVFGL